MSAPTPKPQASLRQVEPPQALPALTARSQAQHITSPIIERQRIDAQQVHAPCTPRAAALGLGARGAGPQAGARGSLWLLSGAAFAASFAAAPAAAGGANYASIVINAQTNEVLHARFADERRYPASITKVMTLYMLFGAVERGEIRLSDPIECSARCNRQSPTKLGLRVGETLTVDEAIRALVTKSANDVAAAVAERIGGSEARFAELMTAKARELGMSQTRFVNASGLPDPRQVTTARDLAVLSQAIMRDFPQMYPYFSIDHMAWRTAWIPTHNNLLGRVNGVDGIKTGYTRLSGFNLTSSAERDGQRVVAVVMGGDTARQRDRHMEELLEAAFAELQRRESERIAIAQTFPAAETRLVSYVASPQFEALQAPDRVTLRVSAQEPDATFVRPAPIVLDNLTKSPPTLPGAPGASASQASSPPTAADGRASGRETF